MERYKNRFTLDNFRLSERYFKGEVHILLHFLSRNGVELVAIFQRKVDDMGVCEKCSPIGDGIVGGKPKKSSAYFCPHAWSHAMGRVLRSDCNQQSVFVDNVKAMEMPEDFSATSTVWFDSVV